MNVACERIDLRIARALMAPPSPPTPSTPDVAERLAHAFTLLRHGNGAEAIRELTASLDDGVRAPLLELARHSARHGRPALSLQILHLVGQARPDILPRLARDPGFVTLRDDPRFLQLTGLL